jgi:hypothetical protein
MGFGYHKWIKDIRKEAASKGLSSYLGLTGFTPITAPLIAADVKRKGEAGTANATEAKTYGIYLDRLADLEDKCAKALAFIYSSISVSVQQSVERTVPNFEVPSIDTIAAVMAHLRKFCGGVWSVTAQRISDDALRSLPMFHTVLLFDEAMDKIRSLQLERSSWSEAREGEEGIVRGHYDWPDCGLVLWLQERVVRSDMSDVSMEIEVPNITYARALRFVEARFDKIRERESRLSVSMAGSVPSDQRQIAPQQSSVQLAAFAADSSPRRPQRTCWNCKSPDHYFSQCKEPVVLSPGSAAKVRCSRCRGLGHYQSQCPSPPVDLPVVQPDMASTSLRSAGKRPQSHVYVRSGDKRVKVRRELLPRVTEIFDNKRALIESDDQACLDEDDADDAAEEIDFGVGLEDELSHLQQNNES